jgi:hypothetical protein
MACHCLEPIVPGKTFDPFRSTPTTSDLEQHMGSTTYGRDGSTGVGLAMPQDIKNQSRRRSPREGHGRA